MVDRLPLPSLLSHVFVAFTIEFDNEFEHLVPHRTTQHGSTAGAASAPWLVSRAMWSLFLRFVDEEGTPLREFQRRVGMPAKSLRMWLTRMSKWWGYVRIDTVVIPTPAGRTVMGTWRTLDGIIERRWRSRFGEDAIDALRGALVNILIQIDVELPESIPILGYGMVSQWGEKGKPGARETANDATVSLVSLAAKVLLAFALEFERDAEVSLAISANALRLVGEEGRRVRDLPRLAGVSKEAIATALSFLCKRGYAKIEANPGGSRLLRLTTTGRQAQETYRRLVWNIEDRWKSRFGEPAVSDLRTALELVDHFAGDPSAERSSLLSGMEPYADCWRASLPKLETLPHYPMVLHRGGFPDGS